MKYSSISYSLFLILLGLLLSQESTVQGFQPATSSSSSSLSFSQGNQLLALTNDKTASIALHASLIDPEQEPEKASNNNSPTISTNNATWKKICDINEKFWDYTVNFFYIFMTVGILMNLSGFAYKVDLEEGFTVQTVNERRQELQWQKEIQRYDQQAAMKQKSLLEKVEMTNHL
ncbi:unnamed protein product [Cylindrotheca closterium]|uniref:Uncharacterized protein n=1 Tax=Cylindrotheca closterium TaxID=2856 RepID=A0AAD2PX13_9STRA|nr:unnamed protein product [Cylindrotheca closterium]